MDVQDGNEIRFGLSGLSALWDVKFHCVWFLICNMPMLKIKFNIYQLFNVSTGVLKVWHQEKMFFDLCFE